MFKQRNRSVSPWILSGKLLMVACAGLTPACDPAADESTFDEEDDDRKNTAAQIWYQCQTATDKNGSRWSYSTNYLNNFANFVYVSVQKDGKAFDPVMLTKIGTDTWSDNKRITLRLEQKTTNDPKTNGTKGIRVDHHTMGWTASAANGWCKVDDRDANGDYCASQGKPHAVYRCDGLNCGCIETGAVPTCQDGVRNQDEKDIDCGGTCATSCVAPTCKDKRQNQGEEDVDCGGPCSISCPPRYTVQIRRLTKVPILYHEDVCVDDACYTAGPVMGTYRRDAASSKWALTNADGWSTTPGWSFDVTKSQRDMLLSYMDSEVANTMGKETFLQTAWEYYSNGFCLTFSRTHFNYMAKMIGGW